MSSEREYRSVPQSTRAVFGGLIDPRAVEYRGRQMRSRLERDFAMHLDSIQVEWEYAPAIYGPKGEGYLPDFRVIVRGVPTFIEIKPRKAEVRGAAERMAVIWDWHPEAVLLIACAEGSTFFAARRGERWRSWVELWKHA